MTWFESLILGLVEGITEFLPVSSTGHLVLTERLLGLQQSEALDAYDIVIQGGAIVAVLGIYRARMKTVACGLVGRDPAGLQLGFKLMAAFVPTAVIGLVAKKFVEAHLKSPGPILLAVVAGAAAIFIVSHLRRGRGPTEGRQVGEVSYRDAVLIGLAQALAIWPGTSRSLVTILAGLLLGLSAVAATEFAFLLGVITLLAATAYKAVKGGPAMMHDIGAVPLAIGIGVSAISAFVAVKWFIAYLTKHGLELFGWYRLALGAVLLALIASGYLQW